MAYSEILSDGPILVVVTAFVCSMMYCCMKYVQTGKNLNIIYNFLSKFKKSDLNFRYKDINNWMSNNPYVSTLWKEFRNTLVFSETVALQEGSEEYRYKDVSSAVQNIQTTVDPLYFFNEDTLIISKFNFKLIQSMPTILTGCGPLFTFLKIAIAFGLIDFSTTENTVTSVSHFMTDMQAAALVSVIAVGSSLVYIVLEKLLYNKFCKLPLANIQEKFGELFASISSEKFLYELLRESKIQNNSTANLIGAIPEQLKSAMNDATMTNLVPYLENVIYGLNQLNTQLKEAAKIAAEKSSVDDLF